MRKLIWRSTICKHEEDVLPPDFVSPTEPSYGLGDREPCVHCEDDNCVAVVKKQALAGVIKIKVNARLDLASQVSEGTVRIDRRRGLFMVRRLHGRETWTMPLDAVAEMVVRTIIQNEVRDKTGANLGPRRRR